MHPKERPPTGAEIDRREFLKKSAGAALAVAGGAALLLPWGSAPANTVPQIQEAGSASKGPTPFEIATPDHPRTLPLFDDNPAIASGLAPETGIKFQIYNWADYIWRKVVNDFAKKYDVKYSITTFDNTNEFISKMSEGSVQFDVTFPSPDLLGKLAAAKLLQPLNHDYLPNISNVWPVLQDPYYDKGSRYSVPYALFTTGIGWRNDMVSEDIPSMSNPYDIFWNSKYRGKTFILDDYREGPAMVLLRNGIYDINTGDPKQLDMVKDQLLQLITDVNVKYDVNDYTELPEGRAAIHQAWSGDMISAPYYFPSGGKPLAQKIKTLSYWFPSDGRGPINNDLIAIPSNAQNPVLAHLFVNYLLDSKVAYANFVNFTGYQPPMNKLDPDRLIADGAVPKNLASTIMRPEDFEKGFLYAELPPATDQMWHAVWQQFQAGS